MNLNQRYKDLDAKYAELIADIDRFGRLMAICFLGSISLWLLAIAVIWWTA